MAFDVEGARKAGYSDAEIAQYLAAQSSFDLTGAKSSGYSDSEVIAHLSKAVTSPGEANSAEQLAAINAGAKTPEEVAAFVKNARAAPKPQEPSVADKVIGAGEAGLATLSGVTGMAGGAVGILQGISNAITRGNFGKPEGWADINEKMKEYAEAATYHPRTAEGQEQAQAVGQALMPLAGHAPELGGIVQGAGQAAKVGATEAAVVLDKARTAVPTAMQKVAAVVQPAAKPTPGTMGSAGAAATDMAAQRRALFDQFGIRKPTLGQQTRDPIQLKFEREVMKTPEGAPIREQIVGQEADVRARLDAWVDATGAERPLPYDAGMYIDDVLTRQYASDKAKVRTEYTTAKKSPEAQKPIDLTKEVTIGDGEMEATSSVLGYLNDRPTGLPSTGLTDFARKSAVKLGLASESDGVLTPKPATMGKVQDWRREISQNTDWTDAAQAQQSTVLKRLIDATADPEAGPLFKRARDSRVRLGQNYENHRVISDLLKKKPGTTDRKVALESVADHIVKGSIDDVQQARRILQRAGPDGHQAWAEVRGQTLRRIREQATNFTKDSTDNKIISPAKLDAAIQELDVGGSEVSKLTLIFGKKGAQQLRDINDLVQYIKTVPPETALNNSNTAATLAAFADVALSGVAGIPAPLATSVRMATRYIKDARLRRRVLEALGDIEAKKPVLPPAAPTPTDASVH